MDNDAYDRVLAYKTDGTIPAGISRQAVWVFRRKYDPITLRDGRLYKTHRNPLLKVNEELRLVPERELHQLLTDWYVDPQTTCQGVNRLYQTIATQYVGVTRAQVAEFLSHQKTAQVHKPAPRPRIVRPIITSRPRERLQIDLIDMRSNPDRNYTWLLSCIDTFSKHIRVEPLTSKHTKHVCAVMEDIFKSDKPNILQSDNGGEFTSDQMKELCDRYGVKQIFGQAYKPSSQGNVENLNRTIKRAIAAYQTQHNTKSWLDAILDIVINYNNTVHSVTGFKPAELHYTTNTRIIDALANKIKRRAEEWVAASPEVGPPIEPGQQIRILATHTDEVGSARKSDRFAKKYVRQWSAGTYTVSNISAGSSVSKPQYLLVNNRTRNEVTKYRHEILPVAKLSQPRAVQSALIGDPLPPPGPPDAPPEPAPSPHPPVASHRVEPKELRPRNRGKEEVEVPLVIKRRAPPKPAPARAKPAEYVPEKIVDQKKVGSGNYYRVKWVGYDDESDLTWEPTRNLMIGREMNPVLKAWRDSHPLK